MLSATLCGIGCALRAQGDTSGDFPKMIRTLTRYLATLSSLGLIVVLLGAFVEAGEPGRITTEVAGRQSTADVGLTVTADALSANPSSGAGIAATPDTATTTVASSVVAAAPSTPTTAAPAANRSGPPATTTTTTAPRQAAQTGSPAPATTTTSTTTTTTTAPAVSSGSGMRLWDTAWQIAAKANSDGIGQYVGRLASAKGVGGADVTGFWFSAVNINQDINTPNGFGHTFGSFAEPNADYLKDVETVIAKAAGQGLRVGIVVAWDGPNQFSVESGKLNAENAYSYGYTIASRWTRPDFGSRWAISAWIMGGDTTKDNGGEHGAVWAEVVRGIRAAEAENGFGGAPVLLHTAPGQQRHYVGASWLSAHAPQTGHCADRNTAVNWMNDLANTGARVWGNGEMRYEGITWSCNGNRPISPDDVLGDAIAMANLGYMANFVYGHDARWNSSRPGAAGMGSGGSVSEGLQIILDEPGLIRSR